MDLINSFRNKDIAKKLLDDIYKIIANKKFNIMEVCGGQTHTIYKYRLKEMLPKSLKLISGPGCPVCVTPINYIDKAISLALEHNVKIFSFGDLLRVPGTKYSLEEAKANGASVTIVYSAKSALEYAIQNPHANVVFLGIGFETTIPNSGLIIREANKLNLKNFSVLLSAKRVPPVLDALLSTGLANINGFITPGHVTAIIGTNAYSNLCKKYSIPMVVGGFEPVDILFAIKMLALELVNKTSNNLNGYSRVVKDIGNSVANDLIEEVFEPIDDELRGLGIIKNAGYKIRSKFEIFDANKKYNIKVKSVEPKGCICGAILSGLKEPKDCKLFRNRCTPDSPIGACMVSSEGTCNAAFLFEDEI